MSIIKQIKEIIIELNKDLVTRDNYDMWDNHLKYVVEESLKLATLYNADKEIVEISAMLHDIALLKYGLSVKEEHHKLGANIAVEILNKLKCPQIKIKQVYGCVLHHRSSKNAENIEELCVADGDILAHFSNLPMMFLNIIRTNPKASIDEINLSIKNFLYADYNDLSNKTQKEYSDRFKLMCSILLKR